MTGGVEAVVDVADDAYDGVTGGALPAPTTMPGTQPAGAVQIAAAPTPGGGGAAACDAHPCAGGDGGCPGLLVVALAGVTSARPSSCRLVAGMAGMRRMHVQPAGWQVPLAGPRSSLRTLLLFLLIGCCLAVGC